MTSILSSEKMRRRNQERYFREAGRKYATTLAPLEIALQEIGEKDNSGKIIKKFILEMGQEIASNPSFQLPVNRKRKNIDMPKDGIFPEEKSIDNEIQMLISIFEKSPFAVFIKNRIHDHIQYDLIKETIINIIIRYGQALRRAKIINQERFGQIDFNFDRYLTLSTRDIAQALNENHKQGDLLSSDDLLIKAEILANLDILGRKFSLLRWLSDIKRKIKDEKLRIFDTPETNIVFKNLEIVAKQHNGIAGVILFGPPGTGKTEILIERNKKDGFDSRVISIHYFTDFLQLLGEKPIAIGLDKSASLAQRLKNTLEVIQGMSENQRLSFIRQQFQKGTQKWNLFLAESRSSHLAINSLDELNPHSANKIIENLVSTIQQNIINVGMGIESGLSEEEAWIKGEIIQAFAEGKRVILDEMDKAGKQSFESISRLLNLSPGEEMPLGNTSYRIPSWARIDGTANAMNLSDFLHNRFAPNIFFIDNHTGKDNLLKALVWVSDESGRISISEKQQSILIGLILYVFPAIQALYPDTIEYPLSNRGIRKFCQMIAGGIPISTAITELLLKPGSLTNNPAAMQIIRKIMSQYPQILSSAIHSDNTHTNHHRNALMDSPLFETCAANFLPFNTNQSLKRESQINPETAQKIIHNRKESQLGEKKHYLTSIGIHLALEKNGSSNSIKIRVNGECIAQIDINDMNQDAIILEANHVGSKILIKNSARQLIIIDIISGKQKLINLKSEHSSMRLSPEGSFLIEERSGNLILKDWQAIIEQDSADEIRIINENNSPIRIESYDISHDDTFLYIRTINNQTFVVDLTKVSSNQNIILSSDHPLFHNDSYYLVEGNLMINSNGHIYSLSQ